MSDSTLSPSGAAGEFALPVIPQKRNLVTELPGPRSRELAARRDAAVASGVSSLMPVFAARAGGGIVVDVDGNHLIDLGSGIAVTTVGHAVPAVVAGVQQQVAEFSHTCFTITPYEGYVAVCEALNRLTPGDFEKRSALFNSGAEAVENAVKIARRATGRDAVVVFDHAYHGRTNLTMAMTAKNMPYKDGFGPFAGEVFRAPMSYPLRDPLGTDGTAAAARAISDIESQVGANRVACLVIEPIQGEGGFIEPAPGFVPALAAWCAANDVLFVADEVQSGFARTGHFFAVEHEGVVPDLVITAKGIAGGMPLSAVTGRAPIMDAAHAGGIGGTYTGNPVSCAAALAAIETIEYEGLVDAGGRLGERLRAFLLGLQQRFPQIAEVRGRGAMQAIELCEPGTLTPDAALAARVARYCHRNGVITLTCGTFGNVIRLLPPVTIGEELLDDALAVLAEAFSAETA
ncbi:4-aminobutyrate--2-oxoglutarate transaminase [Kineosporia sp. J2-2]|uniref:(S)-3-amino-2-methylpropionate transaminase n=1 Tax=Kineosporia corallincola TaxID=2835133 RepID=A0ABS5TSX6_9ACTN|nr:4-aminobutyrate--2-oxoglutarate transaminase [Kineosporia corallincola]MBT0773926.1 4-aminobutyrate--2-oxoglutarate transaminase [Kineosporia corallincola]